MADTKISLLSSVSVPLAGAGACSDTTERLCCNVVTGGSAMANIPANTLTGNYWQLTLTYFI